MPGAGIFVLNSQPSLTLVPYVLTCSVVAQYVFNWIYYLAMHLGPRDYILPPPLCLFFSISEVIPPA